MKKIISLLLFILMMQFSAAQNQDITMALEPFKELKGFDGLSITLIKSDVNKAIITGANTHKVVIVNNDGVLKIRMELEKMFSGYRTFIDLHYTEDLNIIDVNEDALIKSDDVLVKDLLELKAQEGGEINLNCQTDQLLVKAVTGGDVIVKGFTKNQDISINTGGTYNGKLFKSKFTTIAVNAGGLATIYATDYVQANVKAGGSVSVYGNPRKMDEKTVFGGKIERVD
ncbi:head GIN domain-containing protein [Flavobacterium sp. ASW18X]|uniref:head GIN domain-containing protein n=1 Tax=Flavobacterium sp. ASW18X TaxID=2572595 RepID=UPI0010ADEF65|nr:head GIN domain-containing protein [Flavobacterium sp. ASW18X]TKD65128.1 DUF2807 domain-containing protein [Flavobacterium sp. ASW18X]